MARYGHLGADQSDEDTSHGNGVDFDWRRSGHMGRVRNIRPSDAKDGKTDSKVIDFVCSSICLPERRTW